MIVVLIHWRIKTSNEAVTEFFEWWKSKAVIADKTNLVGEFLSAPLPASRFPFRVDDLSHKGKEVDHRAFVNLGIWRDWESFYEQVGKNFNDNNPPLPFEAARRSRTILEPNEWRIGKSPLPEQGTCD